MKCNIALKCMSDKVLFVCDSKVWSAKLLFIFAVLMSAALSSCTKYERQKDCNLDEMNVYGNVTKIETIVKTTMPITEEFADVFDPTLCIPLAMGNTELVFDKKGNIKRSIGYGIDGELLYDEKINSFSDGSCAVPSVLGELAGTNIDDFKCVKEDGKIVKMTYYSNGEQLWEQNVTYDENGNFERIVKEYTEIGQWVKDTTLYNYYDCDSHGNWTRAVVKYKGVFSRFDYEVTVYRQISYDGEGKHDKLINKLSSLNEQSKAYATDFIKLRLGEYGTMNMPDYMEVRSDFDEYTENYLLRYIYKNSNEAYATLSVMKAFDGVYENPFEELAKEGILYDKDFDDFLKDGFTSELLEQSGVRLLKWMPYEIVKLADRYVLKVNYYRYGNGTPIPVYYESYTIPMNDGYVLVASFSYQSNLENRFKADFEKAVRSIDFNR